MIIVEGYFKIAPEHVAQAKRKLPGVIAATRQEDGCIEYSMAEDLMEPGVIRYFERWRDRAAMEAHLRAPHLRDFPAWFKDWGRVASPGMRCYDATPQT